MTDQSDPPTHAGPSQDAERSRRRGPFDYGELRLLVLEMMAERPRHGYELIKLIEERMGGAYSPSPGVIYYPTLAWLETAGYARPEREGGRKRYRATPAGEVYLDANRGSLAEIAVHMGGQGRSEAPPEAVLRGLDEIKRALRSRFAQGPVDAETVDRVAAALRAAARAVTETLAPNPAPAAKLRSVAEVATGRAEAYLGQLCAHFARRASVRREANRGEVIFSIGLCRIEAGTDNLRMIAAAADEESLGRVEHVVESHLVRYALDESLAIAWRRG